MLNIYSDINNLPNNYIFITYIDAFFFNHIDIKDLSTEDKNFMEIIDNAVLLDNDLGTIKTSEGVTSIYNLSTGCKTLIIANYAIKNNLNLCLDINNCGENAIKLLLNAFSDTNLKVYLTYMPFIAQDGDIQVCRDGNIICTFEEYCDYLFEKVVEA